jgi:hypothetical protein
MQPCHEPHISHKCSQLCAPTHQQAAMQTATITDPQARCPPLTVKHPPFSYANNKYRLSPSPISQPCRWSYRLLPSPAVSRADERKDYRLSPSPSVGHADGRTDDRLSPSPIRQPCRLSPSPTCKSCPRQHANPQSPHALPSREGEGSSKGEAHPPV